MNTGIPRRLIQTARYRHLEPLGQACAAALKLLHPDWEYLFFDDDDVTRFIATEFPEYRAVFEQFPLRIQRFDFFRYLAVLRHGGFYLDLDVLLSVPIEDLRSHGCVFPFEEFTINSFLRERRQIDWELGNYAFGATAEHPFVAAVVDNCVRAVTDAAWCTPLINGVPAFIREDFLVLNTTGPGVVTRTFAEQPDLARHVHVLCAGDIFEPQNWHRFGPHGIHLMQASWRKRRGYLGRAVARLWEDARRRRFLADSRGSLTMLRPLAFQHA